MKKLILILILISTTLVSGCKADLTNKDSTNYLSDENIKAELKNLEKINIAPNNKFINEKDYPKTLGVYSKNGLVLVEKYFCSDVCPEYGGVGIYYQNITSKEECANVNGIDKIDPAWGGYKGCTPRID